MRVRRAHMDELTEEKCKIADKYTKGLNNSKIKLPKLAEGASCVWHQYVITCDERDRLIDYLNEKEIGTIIHYPVPPHLQECYKYLGHTEGDFPICLLYTSKFTGTPLHRITRAVMVQIIIVSVNTSKIPK